MRVLVLGAGGHARPVIETLRALGHEVAGLLDDAPGPAVLGAARLGPLASLAARRAEGLDAAVVALGNNVLRAELAAACRAAGFALPVLVHPAAIVSAAARLEDGAQVMARAVIGPEASAGCCALINTGAIVEHECRLAEAAHIGPGAILCGSVVVGARGLVGAGAVLQPGVRVGADATIAAGAAVSADVPEGGRFGGVPARPLPARKGP